MYCLKDSHLENEGTLLQAVQLLWTDLMDPHWYQRVVHHG